MRAPDLRWSDLFATAARTDEIRTRLAAITRTDFIGAIAMSYPTIGVIKHERTTGEGADAEADDLTLEELRLLVHAAADLSYLLGAHDVLRTRVAELEAQLRELRASASISV